MQTWISNTRWVFFFLFWLPLLSGCLPVKLIGDYDEKIDQGVSGLQKKVEVVLSKIERSAKNPSASFSESDYAELKQDLNVLITRASSWDKNELTVKQLYTLGYALLDKPSLAPEDLKLPAPIKDQSLEKRHQSKEAFGVEDIRDLRDILTVNFRAILKLELAKKR